METFLYNPALAREQAAEEIRAAKDLAARCEQAHQDALKERDEMEKRMREMEAEHLRTIHNLEWAHVQRFAEYEDKIAMLEELVAKEREARQQETQLQQHKLQHACDNADQRVRELESHHLIALAASDARALEAEERLEIALRRTTQELAKGRVREEERVKDTRDKAEARLRETEQQKRFELQQIGEHVTQRQKAMDETLVLNGRQKSDAVAEAQRHAAALTAQMEEYLLACKSDQSIMQMRHAEMLQKQKQAHDESLNHQKGLVDLVG